MHIAREQREKAIYIEMWDIFYKIPVEGPATPRAFRSLLSQCYGS